MMEDSDIEFNRLGESASRDSEFTSLLMML